MEPIYRPWEEGTRGDGDDEAEAEDLEGGYELRRTSDTTSLRVIESLSFY